MSDGVKYAVLVYIESNSGLEDDGTLSAPVSFQVQTPSDGFSTTPVVSGGIVTKDGLPLTFRASAAAGQGYAMVVAEANMAALTISGVKSYTNAVGDGPCKWTGFVNDDIKSVALSSCNLIGAKTYYAFVYV